MGSAHPRVRDRHRSELLRDRVPHRARVFTGVDRLWIRGNGPASFQGLGQSRARSRSTANDASTKLQPPGSRPCRVPRTPLRRGPGYGARAGREQLSDRKGKLPNRHLHQGQRRLLPIPHRLHGQHCIGDSAERLGGVRQRPGQSTRPATPTSPARSSPHSSAFSTCAPTLGQTPSGNTALLTTTTARSDALALTSVTDATNSGAAWTCHFRFLPNNSGSIQPSNFWLTDSDVPAGTGHQIPVSAMRISEISMETPNDYMWNYNGWWLHSPTPLAPASRLREGGSSHRSSQRYFDQQWSCNYEFVGDFNGDVRRLHVGIRRWYVALGEPAGDGVRSTLKWLDATAGYGGRPTAIRALTASSEISTATARRNYMWNYEGWQVALSTEHPSLQPTGFWLQSNAASVAVPTQTQAAITSSRFQRRRQGRLL